MAVHGPGGYHPLANTFRLKLGEKFVKRFYHWLSVVISVFYRISAASTALKYL
jgi:hypothetical protein